MLASVSLSLWRVPVVQQYYARLSLCMCVTGASRSRLEGGLVKLHPITIRLGGMSLRCCARNCPPLKIVLGGLTGGFSLPFAAASLPGYLHVEL